MARVASANEARFTEQLVNKQFLRAKIPLRLLWSEWYQLINKLQELVLKMKMLFGVIQQH